jgi:hypothetical protein
MYAGPYPLPELDVLTRAAQQALCKATKNRVEAAGVTSYERRLSDDETEDHAVAAGPLR